MIFLMSKLIEGKNFGMEFDIIIPYEGKDEVRLYY
jgi:hypothetical protein